LAPQEIDALFNTLRTMVSDGKSIIFISHKLHEVMEISDRVTVMSKGKVTASGIDTKQITRQELAHLMVGREVIFRIEKKEVSAGNVVLDVSNIQAPNDKGLPALQGLSLSVRSGEIVGLAGVAGNGQNELSDVIAGLRHCVHGKVTLNGIDITNCSVHSGIQKGMAYIPADRTHVGTAPNLSITDNIIMKQYQKAPFANGWALDMVQAKRFANELKSAYDIVAPTVDIPARLLSGGNLQRVILAREISGKPALLLAVQPTRGLDVGAIEGVQRLLLAQREAGAAILLISEELEELLALSDRIYVIYEGKIMGEVQGDNMDIQTIGMMMTGTPLSQIKNQE
jgi:simple sugar transport system ATP-binding protein